MSLAEEVVILYAVNEGLLEGIPLEQCGAFEDGLLRQVNSANPDMMKTIGDTGDLTGEIEADMTKAITDFKATFTA